MSFSFGGKFTPLVKVLFALNIAMFIAQIAAEVGWKTDLAGVLGVSPLSAFTGRGFFTIFTYMWLHSTQDIQHIFFNLFTLWMCGGMLEEKIKWRHMLAIYIVAGIGGGLGAALFSPANSVTIGASGAIFGVIVAWGYYLAEKPMLFLAFIPTRVKYIAMVLVGFNLLLCLLPHSSNVSYVGHVGGALAASILIFSSPFYKKRVEKYRIHSEIRKMEEEVAIRHRVDQLLEKISREGITSLSPEEKRFLTRASKDYHSDND